MQKNLRGSEKRINFALAFGNNGRAAKRASRTLRKSAQNIERFTIDKDEVVVQETRRRGPRAAMPSLSISYRVNHRVILDG